MLRSNLSRRFFILWPLGLAMALGACFVDSVDPREVVQVNLALQLPGPRTVAPGGSFSPWDSSNIFWLDRWSKYVRVALVDRDDLEVPALNVLPSGSSCTACYPASWPSPARDVVVREGELGQLEVELIVEAKDELRLRVLGYHVEPSTRRVVVYREGSVQSGGTPIKSLNLRAGTQTDLDVIMQLHPSGTVDATIRCKDSAGDTHVPMSLALRDARSQVLYPFQPLTQSINAFKGKIYGVPVGRPHYTHVLLQHLTDSSQRKTIVVTKPNFTLTTPNDTQLVNIDIPCKF